MKLQNNFKAEIKPKEWLYIAAVIVIIASLMHADMQTALKTLTEWLKIFK